MHLLYQGWIAHMGVNVTGNRNNAKAMPSSIFFTTVNFELEYFLNEETVWILANTLVNFNDWHLTWLSQVKPNVKVGQCL